MAKGSGGTRTKRPSSKKIETNAGFEPLKETEKAVMVNMTYEADVAPQGGFTSSMVKDIAGTMQVWIPKSQIKDGVVSEWIAQNKNEDAQKLVLSKFTNGQILSSKVTFVDKNGKPIKVETSQTEAKLAAGLKKHDALLKQAKGLGLKAKVSMKSTTLQKMISDNQNGVVKSSKASTSTFEKSSTKVQAGNIVQGKYGQGVIEKIITKSSGYVQVRYSNGTVKKEMAFNLKGEDGKYLKKKP